MNRLVECLRGQIGQTVTDLGAKPGALFALVLAANALAMPYRGIYHDAHLYGLQVLHNIDPGHYADDLYFLHGSQDRYSLFSPLTTLVVARLGLPAAFCLLYLLCNSFLLWALVRLVRAVVKDPIIMVGAALFLAVTPIPFAGLQIFHVNEPFLSARVPANALVLLALERYLAGRRGTAVLLTVVAMPIHPLMAFPGFLATAGLWTYHRLGLRWVIGIGLAGLGLTAAVMLTPSLGIRIFGEMTPEWRANVLRFTSYHFPYEWEPGDWVRVAASLLVAAVAVGGLGVEPRLQQLLLMLGAVGVAGLALGMLACFLPYALLMQGQAYRWIWPLQTLLYPLTLLLAHRLWQFETPQGRIGALVLGAALLPLPWSSPFLWGALTVGLLMGVVGFRGLGSVPRRSRWGVPAILTGFAFSLVALTGLRFALLATYWDELGAMYDGVEYAQLAWRFLDSLTWLGIVLLLATAGRYALGTGWRFRMATGGVCVALTVGFAILLQTNLHADAWSNRAGNIRFVKAYLAKHREVRRTPTLYWPGEPIGSVWFGLETNCYFERDHQIAGNLFSPRTAAEGERRAILVRSFELDQFRRIEEFSPPEMIHRVKRLYQAEQGELPPPRLEDLLAVARDARVDIIVLDREYEGHVEATNGIVFIYDCAAMRAREKGDVSIYGTP